MCIRIIRRFIAHLALVLFLMPPLGWAIAPEDAAQLASKVAQTWTTDGSTRIRTVRDRDGRILSQRIYDRTTGRFLREGAPGIMSGAIASPAAATTPTPAPPACETASTEQKAEPKKKAKKKIEPPAWTGHLTLGSRLDEVDQGRVRSYEELYKGEKDGIGVAHFDLRRVSTRRLFRIGAESFGTWNHSMGARLDFRHESAMSIRAKFRRTEWDFGTVLDPETLRTSFQLDAGWDRPDLRYWPRVVVGFRGQEITGDMLRLQGSTAQVHPRDRFANAWNPSSRDFTFGVFVGQGRCDASLSYAENVNRNSDTKLYQQDIDFNGIRDLLQIWKWQQNFSKTLTGKVDYRFNDRYSLGISVSTTQTDNEFDTIRLRQEPVGFAGQRTDQTGLHGQDHGWLDGHTRLEEYVLQARPDDRWDVEARIERRTMRARADGRLRWFDNAGILTATDDTATCNRIDEGLAEVRADYHGFARTPIYVGYRWLDREELDDDTLGTYAYNAAGNRTWQPTTRALDRWSTLESVEKMGFVGVHHAFDPRWSIDLRHETGQVTDQHGARTGYNLKSLVGTFDKTRQVAVVRARPDPDWSMLLKLRRDQTDRGDIGAADERRAVALFATWTPARRKFTVGSGYTRTIGDLQLRTASFQDEIETVSLNGTYRFDDRWSATLDLWQAATGDVTRQDYQTGQIKLRRQLRKGHEASIGYARRFFENRDRPVEDFTAHVFLFAYELPL
ncbi:MAG: hypothetical protein OZSIB_2648 [Candidatus Ozemobacter sibiricus]|jgi:hypothetical protein|uniref:Uncharacterized protein n=1 Tax=Candidatus Ozemobacter sibiricus TaxID=2268124 RepID=A0A367ZRU3_9BACT|nr:MAG: hypothetical protein OZSIB_2648 [Candidatus Ozemobacter sibiricus]